MRFLIAAAILLLAAGPSHAQDRLTGYWKGYWTRAGDTMLVTMNVARDSAQKYVATFDADRLRVSGIPFGDVQVQGCCHVTFTLRGDRTTLEFSGKLRGDSLIGTFREENTEGRFAFRRAPPGYARGTLRGLRS